MKSIIATLALLTLTGCASFEQLQAEGQEIRMRGSMGMQTTNIRTPQGSYIVHSRVRGTTTDIDVRRIR